MIKKNMLTLNLPLSISYQYSKVEQKQIEQHIWKKYFNGIQSENENTV
jgi:hypothetical protein